VGNILPLLVARILYRRKGEDGVNYNCFRFIASSIKLSLEWGCNVSFLVSLA